MTGRTFTYRLPWAPSINTYWRRNGHIYFISAKGKAFRKETARCVGDGPRLAGRLGVFIECVAPTRRKYDLDNLPKSILDALQHAGVFLDDSQVDELRIKRLHVEAPGACDVTIVELQEPPA